MLDASTIFVPHRNLSGEINSNIIQSEVEGGVHLRDLLYGETLEVVTRNRPYTLVIRHDDHVLISGHPEFCPEPVLVHINGSTWGGSMIKLAFVGRGMHLEFRHPDYIGPILTSQIVDVRLKAA